MSFGNNMKIVHALKDGSECKSISKSVIKRDTNQLLYLDLLKIEQGFDTKNATAIQTSKNRPC